MESDSRLYLVTGGTGFVGGVLADLMLSRNMRVRLLVRKPDKAAQVAERGAEIIQGDINDPAALQVAVRGVYGIHHIAAVYREANLSDETFFKVNVEGTRQLFEAAVAAGVSRIIHCSTGGVLGDIKNPPGNEHSPYAPDDVYQESKVQGEKLALEYFRSGKISGAIIRPGMIYGPTDTRFLKLFRAVARRRFVHIGSGKQWVHYVDVRDLCRAFLLAMERAESNAQIYTIAGRAPLSFKEMIDIIAAELGVRPPTLHLPLRPVQWAGSICEALCKPFGISPPLYRRRVDFFAKNRYFDISKAETELGYRPAQSVQEEVSDVCAWYKTKGWL